MAAGVTGRIWTGRMGVTVGAVVGWVLPPAASAALEARAIRVVRVFVFRFMVFSLWGVASFEGQCDDRR